ncbi:MAG: hypothetical protein ABI430_04005 [Candidatus Taylorbacteria bacterium]
MSKTRTKIEIYKELKKVNREIDRKIIKGVPYGSDSKHHKFLLSRLRTLTGKKWLPRSLSFFSFLL